MKELKISEDFVSPAAAVSRISRAKDEMTSAEQFEEEAVDYWSKRFAKIYLLYQSELIKQNGMDFGDLLFNGTKLFKQEPGILRYFQEKFQYIHVDEYQDTNHVQYSLVTALTELHKNIFVVGDDDQSIYRWRGADIRNILEFQDDFPGATTIRLEQNYRSTPTILKAANAVIQNNGGRLGKTLWTDLPDKEKVSICQKDRDLDEVKEVARRIGDCVRNGYRYNDIGIFYRTNAQSRLFEESFRNFGIPYVIYGGIRFYERLEIRDLLAYLRLIQHTDNDTAFLRIVNRPPRGIGKTTIEKVQRRARENNNSLFVTVSELLSERALSPRAHKSLHAFYQMIRDLHQRLDELPLGDLTSLLIEAAGYLEHHQSSKSFDAEDRIENVREFLRATYEFKEVSKESLPAFLDQVALVSDVDSMDQSKGVVPLMTVHLSKGLEFPIVFMVGMEEGLFPHQRSIDSDEELEEERRLCYVGMTRAKEKLYMYYSCRRRIFGREQYNLPSRFIDEVDSTCVDREYFNLPQAAKSWTGRSDVEEPHFEEGYDATDDFDQRPPEEIEDSAGFRVGARVKHPLFGAGIIQRVDGAGSNQKVMLRLQNGQIKTLVVKYAQLEVL